MSDSLRTDGSGAVDAVSDAGRDGKIEELLLAGLDHYFAGRYEHAVNVWTRALFLDRSHPRARAYIERARGAMAERQRESEELLQRGLVALNGGEGEEAKRLLLAAVDQGAPADEVQILLDRLDRSRAPEAPRVPGEEKRGPARPLAPRATAASQESRKSSVRLAVTTIAALGIAAGLVYWVAGQEHAWPAGWWSDPPAPAGGAPAVRDSMPPVPRSGEIALERARDLTASGQLHQALAVLESVRATDAERPEADRMRAEIQQRLLTGATGTRPAAAKPLGRQQ
jgi:hypothetical protein